MRTDRDLHPLTRLCNAAFAATLVIAFMAPPQTSAKEYYTGNVVGKCESHKNLIYNVKATIGPSSPNWFVTSLEYIFTPTPTASASVDTADGKTRYFLVTPGTYKVTAQDPGLQGSYSVKAPDCSPPPKGMTWRLVKTNAPSGTVRVGCGHSLNKNECNPSKGDTYCTEALPILCIKNSGDGFPLPLPATVDNASNYNKWSGGIVATTSATIPPQKLADANALCSQQFGVGWRVAEHHDGWGWYFQAYGGVGDPSSRFWVHIKNQPGGTCWE